MIQNSASQVALKNGAAAQTALDAASARRSTKVMFNFHFFPSKLVI